VAINEHLQQEAQAVLDVIENPDVAQALRQDKNQNLTYLKDNYGVSDDVLYGLNILTPTIYPSFYRSSPSNKLQRYTTLGNFSTRTGITLAPPITSTTSACFPPTLI
jgi:hypothetical protein